MLAVKDEKKSLGKVFIKNDLQEFLDNLNKFFPDTVFFAKRTLWFYMGNYSQKSSNGADSLFAYFHGNEVWPEGLREALNVYSDKSKEKNATFPQAYRRISNVSLKIGGDEFPKGSQIYYFNPHIGRSFESNLRVPLLEVTYSFLNGDIRFPDTYQFKAERMYSLKFSREKQIVKTITERERKVGIINRKKIPAVVREVSEMYYEYDWVEPDVETLKIHVPPKIKIVQGIPYVQSVEEEP